MQIQSISSTCSLLFQCTVIFWGAAIGDVLGKRLLLKFRNTPRKTTASDYLFNKVSGLGPTTLLKKGFQFSCFSVNSMKVFRTSFIHNTSGRLLLYSGTHVWVSAGQWVRNMFLENFVYLQSQWSPTIFQILNINLQIRLSRTFRTLSNINGGVYFQKQL